MDQTVKVRMKKNTPGTILALAFGFLLWYWPAMAQVGPKKPSPAKTTAKPAAATIKPDTVSVPKFTVRFGPYTGTTPAPANDLKKVIGGELTVTDQQGQKWTPIAWRLIWNRKEINDDWKTGKRKTIMTYNIVEVDSTAQLPESWQNEIREFIQPGEEIIFERIIIEHPGSKRNMGVAELRIKVI